MESAPLPQGPQPPMHPYDTDGDVSGPLSIGVEVSLVLANIFPILVVCKIKHPKDRIPGDEVVLGLSVTDILSVVVPSPLGLAAYFGQHWYGGERACDFYQVTINWFQLASMCLVTYMCIDRCLALRRTMAFKPQVTNLTKTRIIILLIYLFTLAVSSLPLIGLAPEGLSPSGCLCRSVLLAPASRQQEGAFSIVFLVVGFANLAVAIVVNSNVVYRLWRFKKDFGARSADRRMNNICADVDRRSVVEMTVMTLVVTLVFYLAWMPVLVSTCYFSFSPWNICLTIYIYTCFQLELLKKRTKLYSNESDM